MSEKLLTHDMADLLRKHLAAQAERIRELEANFKRQLRLATKDLREQRLKAEAELAEARALLRKITEHAHWLPGELEDELNYLFLARPDGGSG